MEGPTNASCFDVSIMKHWKENAWFEAMMGAGFAKVQESLPNWEFQTAQPHLCTFQAQEVILIAFDTEEPDAVYPHRRASCKGRLRL